MMVAFFVAWLAVIVLAWTLTQRRPEYEPIAVLLSVGFAADAVYPMLALLLRSAYPRAVWASGMLANGLALVWPAALVAAALVVFAGKKPWGAALGWACALAALAIGGPIAGDGSEPHVLTMVQVVASLSAAGIGLVWYRTARRARTAANSAHFALMAIIVTEVVALLGAWRIGPSEHWPVSQALYVVMFGIVGVMQGRFLCSSQPSLS
jgi:hypothetical protein